MEWFDLEDVIVVAYGPFFCWFSYSVEATDLWKLAVTMIYQGIPTILGVFITIISYNLVIKQIKEVPKEILEVMNVDVYRLYWYPAVFIITFVPSLIDKIVRIYIEDRPVIFEAAHLLLTHSIGFNNALVYGIQRKLHTMHNNVYIHSKVTSFVDMNNRESILSYDGD